MPTEPDLTIRCDRCKERMAVLCAHYPGIRPRPPRWCPDCAGPALAALVLRGQVVTVTPAAPGRHQEPNGKADQDEASTTTAGADGEVSVGELDWTVDRAARMLRLAQPGGVTFLRALVDEGGIATAARLREITGATHLNPMTQTLNHAMKKVFSGRRLTYDDRHLARPGRDPEDPRRPVVYDYSLPPHLVPILDQALRQLGR